MGNVESALSGTLSRDTKGGGPHGLHPHPHGHLAGDLLVHPLRRRRSAETRQEGAGVHLLFLRHRGQQGCPAQVRGRVHGQEGEHHRDG